ncbi:hypothetical protein BCR32DRAFT_101103 [Anaeromyces robustus]|uniref:G-protein coupled receptors family 3 profile domain-containing protein n=1 Tax=Anaeromyces robustus TaxID=1754192 RepID=A0A1Y1WHH2_9FUNG|nr:hypothetical protein BCR32DRAFT_101103 [Anaeromyces robustus]|eukprot:ORX72574.1 hypothetical protein BCR32DRAFT_101103 [Anaeromyces robustus]
MNLKKKIYIYIYIYIYIKDEIFRTDTVFDVNLFEKNALFIKFWIFYEALYMDNYVISILPGIKEGISGASLVGSNIGIDSSIDNEKKEAAIEAIKFMTSLEFQKSLVLKQWIVSGILSLYDDKEVCSTIKNCEFYKNVQPIAKPVDKTDNYIEYAEKFTNYFYEYLYGNKNISEESILKKMDDITKFYSMTIDSKETSIGLITFILYSVTLVLMILSSTFPFINFFKKHFSNLTKPSWMIIMLGIIIILMSGYTNYGTITNFKCQIKHVLFSVGNTFIYAPMLYRLIIFFPEENKYSTWIKNHNVKFFLILILLDSLFNGLAIFKPHSIKNIIINDGNNFQICHEDSLFSIISHILLITYKFIFLLGLLLLIFIEWNIKETFFDMKYLLSSIYINIICLTIYIILDIFFIRNYIWYFILQECLIYIISLSNYIILYGIKLLFPKLSKTDEINKIIKQVRVSESLKNQVISSNENVISKAESDVSKMSSKSSSTVKNSAYSKILCYHYRTSAY